MAPSRETDKALMDHTVLPANLHRACLPLPRKRVELVKRRLFIAQCAVL